MQAVAVQVLAQGLQQRHAVHAVVGRAERRLVRAVAPDRMVGDHLAGVAAADHQRGGNDRDGLDLLAEPEAPQLPRAVGRQRDRRADLAQFVCLLVDVEVDPALAQSEREDQASDAAADDRDLHGVRRSRECGPGPARSRT